MKKLRKIQLKDAVILPANEMRQIRGGGIEVTTGFNCQNFGSEAICVAQTTTCYVTSSLKGRCAWITGINSDTHEIVGVCDCRWTNPN